MSDGLVEQKFSNRLFELYEAKGPTKDLDYSIEMHWAPRVITQPLADWDGDGKLDLAYWEPRDHIIYVSFDFGKSIEKNIEVPENSIPIHVNLC